MRTATDHHADEHVIISGTGRAGTTFLVQYFTALGLDTGYELEEALSAVDTISSAGLERSLFDPNLPYIVKSPWYADYIDEALTDRQLRIRLAIIPMRDLFAAAESRRRVHRLVASSGGDPLNYPGTLWKTDEPDDQEHRLADQFYKLVHGLVKHRVPIVFLYFPQFVFSHKALFDSLRRFLGTHRISVTSSRAAHQLTAQRHLVHSFDSKVD